MINESQFADADLAALHNLVAAIIRLENTRSFDDEKALAE
ncbi:MAG TPA: transposase, partial [Beggiatoa sp.]|nr:transposase [Beggiatoa sp.]